MRIRDQMGGRRGARLRLVEVKGSTANASPPISMRASRDLQNLQRVFAKPPPRIEDFGINFRD